MASPYVLVHGAWHGGWCWSRVAPQLRAAGHEVYTPTLAGLGEHAHLLNLQITLDTHVEDVVRLFESYDIEGAVLIGHSYGGLVITGAADRLHDSRRIARLVYLDAMVPRDGEGWSTFLTAEQNAARVNGARAHGGLFLPPPEPGMFGLSVPEDVEWVRRHLTPHPYGPYLYPVRLPNLAKGGGAAALPRTYISCTAPFYSGYMGLKERIRSDTGWKYVELASGHDAMVSAPSELAGLLLAG